MFFFAFTSLARVENPYHGKSYQVLRAAPFHQQTMVGNEDRVLVIAP